MDAKTHAKHVIANAETMTIASTPRGKVAFGSDAIFIPKGYSKTWSEMDEKELADTAVTRVALAKLRSFLESRTL